MLIYIVNLRTPHERRAAGGIPEEEQSDFLRRLRNRTEKYWPELWKPVNEGETTDKTNDRAFATVIRMRGYLRSFWKEPDEHARDWYIHRAREFYQRHFVLRDPTLRYRREVVDQASTAEEARDAMSWVNIEIERVLDEPPQHNLVEDALFELQQRALIPSKRPLYCQNADCERPYFLSEKKGTKFCSPDCSQAGIRASKRKSWGANKNNWRGA